MAKESGLSHDTIARIWRAFGLQPHRQEQFKLSTDPFFVEKVRDIVGLYMSPPERALVLCVDEKIRFRHWNAASLCFHSSLVSRNGPHMITSGMAPPRSLRPWTLPRAKSLAAATDGIAIRSSCAFWTPLTNRFQPISTFIW